MQAVKNVDPKYPFPRIDSEIRGTIRSLGIRTYKMARDIENVTNLSLHNKEINESLGFTIAVERIVDDSIYRTTQTIETLREFRKENRVGLLNNLKLELRTDFDDIALTTFSENFRDSISQDQQFTLELASRLHKNIKKLIADAVALSVRTPKRNKKMILNSMEFLLYPLVVSRDVLLGQNTQTGQTEESETG